MKGRTIIASSPAAAIRGKVGNISFSTRGLYLFVDVISGGSDVDFDLGPIAGVRLNRSSKIKDDVVDLLPELDSAFEVGGFAGVSFHGLTNPYDTLAVRLDAVKDIGDAHGSTVITPNLEFSTPLSRSFFMGASLSADFVSNDFADYYYSITPVDALASGLAPFDADGGMKSWKIGLLANYSLSGDLLHGWSLFGTADLFPPARRHRRIRRSSTIAAAPANGSAQRASPTAGSSAALEQLFDDPVGRLLGAELGRVDADLGMSRAPHRGCRCR